MKHDTQTIEAMEVGATPTFKNSSGELATDDGVLGS
jgi:hypothetical protein